MPKVIFRVPTSGQIVVDAAPHESVMQAALANNVSGIIGECGGQAMCATCHVYVDADALGDLPDTTDDEDAMLDMVACERRPNSRLSCQIEVTDERDGLIVDLPETQI